MKTEHFFPKIEEIPFDAKLENPTDPICFGIRHTIQKMPSRPSTPSETTTVYLRQSTVDLLRKNPSEAKISLSEQSDFLGINSITHARLIDKIVSHLDSVMNSESGLSSVLLFDVLNASMYHSLRFVKDREGEDICSICSEEIDEYSVRTRCGHVFHGDCITKWLDESDSCPHCWFAAIGPTYAIGPFEVSSWEDVPDIIIKNFMPFREIESFRPLTEIKRKKTWSMFTPSLLFAIFCFLPFLFLFPTWFPCVNMLM